MDASWKRFKAAFGLEQLLLTNMIASLLANESCFMLLPVSDNLPDTHSF